MTSVTARKLPAPTLEAIADDILFREIRFGQLARRRGPTPLEELRVLLRKGRRRIALRSFVFGRAAVPSVRVIESASRISPQRESLSASKPRLLPGWRAALAISVSMLALHLTAPPATEAIAHTILARIPNGNVTAIDKARECVQARPVLDASGVLVGVSPLRQCASEYKLLSASVSVEAASQMYRAWRALEGEYRIAPSTFSGLNVKGWTRAVLQQARLLPGRSGGSSPVETATKNLLERPGRLSRTSKLRSGFDTLTYTARRLPDAERDRYVTENIPCVAGLRGSDFGFSLAGDLCPLFLFGKTADALDWAERCIWAGTAQLLYWVVGDDSSERQIGYALYAETRIRERAKDCLQRLGIELGWTPQQTAAWNARLERASFSAQRYHGEGIESVDLQSTMPGVAYAFRDEMRLNPPANHSAPTRLSIAAREQREAYESVTEAAKLAEVKLASGLCLFECNESSRPADAVAILAEIVGERLRIRLAVTTGHFLLSGSIERTEVGTRRAKTDRSVGSTNKPWLLVRLVAEKNARQLCGQVPVGATARANDTGRLPCADGQGLVDVRRAIARSLNPPFADAIHRIGIEQVKAYFRDLGFDFDPDLRGGELVDGLVLGYRVTAAPAVLMRNMAALYRGYIGEEPKSSLPALIVDQEPSSPFSWRDVGIAPEHLREAGALLAAPIADSDGTLRSFAPLLARYGCTRGIGKTGTSDSAIPDEVRDKIVLTAFQCGARRYVAFGLIGSPSVQVPLGKVQTADVVKLIDALLANHNR